MPSQPVQSDADWLSLHAASKKIGVARATLRQWANQGRIRTFRTPGGHRRFSASELSALVGTRPVHTPNPRIETLVHAALGRARFDIDEGRLAKSAWYRRFDEQGKENHRKLGRKLLSLLLRVLRGSDDEKELRGQARKLGREYGRTSLQERIQLTDALRAFLFFRDHVFEDLIGFTLSAENLREVDSLERYRRASAFVNEILVSMVETFLVEKKK